MPISQCSASPLKRRSVLAAKIAPFGHHLTSYEAKRDEIAPWMDDGNPKVRAFATWLAENLDQMVVHERQRAAENLALRKHRYGVGQNDQAAS